jgi:hypothetical protein
VLRPPPRNFAIAGSTQIIYAEKGTARPATPKMIKPSFIRPVLMNLISFNNVFYWDYREERFEREEPRRLPMHPDCSRLFF